MASCNGVKAAETFGDDMVALFGEAVFPCSERAYAAYACCKGGHTTCLVSGSISFRTGHDEHGDMLKINPSLPVEEEESHSS